MKKFTVAEGSILLEAVPGVRLPSDFNQAVRMLYRPYTPISEADYQQIMKQADAAGTDVFLMGDEALQVTFGNADSGYALMPLQLPKPKANISLASPPLPSAPPSDTQASLLSVLIELEAIICSRFSGPQGVRAGSSREEEAIIEARKIIEMSGGPALYSEWLAGEARLFGSRDPERFAGVEKTNGFYEMPVGEQQRQMIEMRAHKGGAFAFQIHPGSAKPFRCLQCVQPHLDGFIGSEWASSAKEAFEMLPDLPVSRKVARSAGLGM